jgi:hypothetical protein
MAFHFVAFDHSFPTLVAFQFFLNMAFHFVAFHHSFPTLVAFQFFLNMVVHFVAMTIHSQHWWPFHFFSSTWPFICGP